MKHLFAIVGTVLGAAVLIAALMGWRDSSVPNPLWFVPLLGALLAWYVWAGVRSGSSSVTHGIHVDRETNRIGFWLWMGLLMLFAAIMLCAPLAMLARR